MKTITIKDTAIPVLGYGTWQLLGKDCLNGTAAALDIGYRHIDTAQIYDNESEVGTALKNSGVAREDIFLTTKIWVDEIQGGTLQTSFDTSLQKLKTDYVDLLLLHWPVPSVPLKHQLAALEAVQKSGRAKLIGVSNYTVALMKETADILGAAPATNQVEYHPFLSQKPVLDYIQTQDMFLTAYSPLDRGNVAKNSVLQEIGRKYNKTPGQITLRWFIQQDKVIPIPKAKSEKHIRENFEIFDFTLSPEDMKTIHALAHSGGRQNNGRHAPAWDAAA